MEKNIEKNTNTELDDISIQRNYKDTVFRMIFKDKKELLVLYNAINGTHYDNTKELKIKTLENAIYMSMKNDVSFVIDMVLSLYEHQSTVNPNLPLRDLDYVSRNFAQFYYKEDVYSPDLIKLPNPRFIVFYNGKELQPAKKELKLSDAYEHTENNPQLELIVTQININPGYNDDLMTKCPTLKQYMLYVERVRHYQKTMSLKEAVTKAVDQCIKEGILADFLKRNKSEVISMRIFEYDEKLHEETMRKIGKREGIEKMAKLTSILIKSNRLDDLTKASEDEEYRTLLFSEFNL